MGSLVRWLAGLAGLAGLARLLRRRRTRPASPRGPASGEEPTAGAGEDDPAEALRRKLAQARGGEAPLPAAGAPEPAPPMAGLDGGPTAGDERAERLPMEERRARIHARAQEAIEAMHGDDV